MKVLSKIGEFFENIWYHYKWLILIVLTLGSLMIIGIAQMIGKGDPDVHILFIGQNYITAEGRKEAEKSLSKVIPDYNGDGKVSMDLVELTVTTIPGQSYDYVYQQDAMTRFETEIRAGMSTVFIVEESFYDKITKLGLAAPLSVVFGEGKVPKNAFDEFSFRLRDLDIAEEAGFSRFPRESYVCIRHSPENDEINYSRTMEDYEHNLDFFKKAVEYRSAFVMDRPTIGILHADEASLTNLSIDRLDDGVYYTWKEFEKTSVASVVYGSVKLEKNPSNYDMEEYANKIAEEIKSGKYGIVFIDTAYLDAVKTKGVLSSTDDVFASTSLESNNILPYGVYYDALEIKDISGFCYMNGSETEKHTLAVSLVSPEFFSSEEEYERCKAYYKHLCEFVVPETDV